MHLKRQHILAFLLLLSASVAVRADKVDDYVKSEMQRQHLPGLSLVVIKDHKIVKVQGYGLANIELNVPATPETVYKIGSVSKQFIATGIMLLVQDGKIKLDDSISQFLTAREIPAANCRCVTSHASIRKCLILMWANIRGTRRPCSP